MCGCEIKSKKKSAKKFRAPASLRQCRHRDKASCCRDRARQSARVKSVKKALPASLAYLSAQRRKGERQHFRDQLHLRARENLSDNNSSNLWRKCHDRNVYSVFHRFFNEILHARPDAPRELFGILTPPAARVNVHQSQVKVHCQQPDPCLGQHFRIVHHTTEQRRPYHRAVCFEALLCYHHY